MTNYAPQQVQQPGSYGRPFPVGIAVRIAKDGGGTYVQEHEGACSYRVQIDLSQVPQGCEYVLVPEYGGSYGAAYCDGVPALDPALFASVSVGSGYRAVWAVGEGGWSYRRGDGRAVELELEWAHGHARTGRRTIRAYFTPARV